MKLPASEKRWALIFKKLGFINNAGPNTQMIRDWAWFRIGESTNMKVDEKINVKVSVFVILSLLTLLIFQKLNLCI